MEKRCGIAIVKEYKYLGIIIEANGTIKNHISFMKRRLAYLIKKMYWLKHLELRDRYTLWMVFFKSYLLYLIPAL